MVKMPCTDKLGIVTIYVYVYSRYIYNLLVLLFCKLQVTSDDHIIIRTFIKSKEKARTPSHRRSSKGQSTA